MKKILLLSLALTVSACSVVPNYPHYSVTDAASTSINSQNGLRSTLNFEVKKVGYVPDENNWYLNALQNYRLPENVSIVINEGLEQELNDKFNLNSLKDLKNKSIEVFGLVKREKIFLYRKGQFTGKYYYQNHLQLNNSDQITLVD